jgi:hypothetical protein
MPSADGDGGSGASADERDVGWGDRDWADEEASRAADEDADLERLRAERPPHHEERDR